MTSGKEKGSKATRRRSGGTQSHYQKLARWLDDRFRIPGTHIRFGLDPVLGLFPGLGDWIGGLISLYFLYQAARNDARIFILFRMLINILIDLLVGTIPVIGDIFDVGWKANIKNAELLNELERNPEKTKKQSKIIVWMFFAIAAIIILGLIYLIGWMLVTVISFILQPVT